MKWHIEVTRGPVQTVEADDWNMKYAYGPLTFTDGGIPVAYFNPAHVISWRPVADGRRRDVGGEPPRASIVLCNEVAA